MVIFSCLTEKPRNMNDFLQGKNDDGFFQKVQV